MFIPHWFMNCEVFPELPFLQGWVEAMTSLGRLIFLDQPGTGISDPDTPGALPTMEQWADSITAVLDDLGSREAVLLAGVGALATGALFAATHPSRTTALVALEVYADPMAQRTDGLAPEEVLGPEELTAAMAAMFGTGQLYHLLNPDMPWNEEIRATWRHFRGCAASQQLRTAGALPRHSEAGLQVGRGSIGIGGAHNASVSHDSCCGVDARC